MTISLYTTNILSLDEVEFPFLDDCAIPFEHNAEGLKYNPYKVPPAGCGANLDQFG